MQANEDTVVEEVRSKPKGSKWYQWGQYKMLLEVGFFYEVWERIQVLYENKNVIPPDAW
jgi:hypothetical protein